ncbi:MAG: hypothetical protein M3Y91_00215 [Actinomycetota bacterium]|nr:hypothetical protein [Actinomycetota bacterium]
MHDRPILLVATSTRHDAYVALVVLHAVVAIIAFGAIAVSGVYGSTARRLSRAATIEELRRYFAKPLRTEWAVLAVAPLGAVALLVDPHGSGLGQIWVGAALLLWILASLVWLALVRPAEIAIGGAVTGGRRRVETDADGGRTAGESPEATGALTVSVHGRRLARAGAVTDIVFVLALALMVFQPA